MSDNYQDAGDTLGDMGEALNKDAKSTMEDGEKAKDWVADKAGDVKDMAENAAEKVGLNDGDPNRSDD